MDAYRGQLFVEGNRHGLEAGISIDAKHLFVRTDGDTWTWPIREVVVQRWEGNSFKLNMGDEEFLFTADDPLTFTFEVVDLLKTRRSRITMRHRRPRGRRTGADSPSRPRTYRTGGDSDPSIAVVRESVPATATSAQVWTDLANGREEATLMRALASLPHTKDHLHSWVDVPRGEAGIVRTCSECSHVLIDLIEAENPSDESLS